MRGGATLEEPEIEDDGSLGPVYDWGEEIPESRHAEMLLQDRNRLIVAGASGIFVAFLMILGSWIWVRTLRAPVQDDPATAASIARPSDFSQSDEAEKAAIEAKLRALSPHEALSVAPVGGAPKRVTSERIVTEPN